MSKTASAQVKLSAAVTYLNTDTLGNSFGPSPTISVSFNLPSATITKMIESGGTISSPTTINFASVADVFGATLTFTKVLGIFVQNNSTTQTLTIGGGSQPVCGSDQYTIGPGTTSTPNVFFQNSTFNVTSGSAQNLLLTPSGSLSYSLIAVGV